MPERDGLSVWGGVILAVLIVTLLVAVEFKLFGGGL